MKICAFHGSEQLFNEFSYDEIGLNGTAEGKGFYFTNDKRIASNYAQKEGFIYTAYLHCNKPMYARTREITREQLAELIKVLDDEDDYLSNWGEVDYEGYNKVLNVALDNLLNNEDDIDIISSLANECGSIEMVNRAVYNTLGYDVIIEDSPKWEREQTIYVALVNDIIEIVEVENKSDITADNY